jgi:hypothetical protein
LLNNTSASESDIWAIGVSLLYASEMRVVQSSGKCEPLIPKKV